MVRKNQVYRLTVAASQEVAAAIKDKRRPTVAGVGRILGQKNFSGPQTDFIQSYFEEHWEPPVMHMCNICISTTTLLPMARGGFLCSDCLSDYAQAIRRDDAGQKKSPA